MTDLNCVVSEEEIARGVSDLARRISEDYKDRDLVLVGVLNGAFIFLADLARRLTIPHMVDFVRVKSYGRSTESAGVVTLVKDVELPLAGKDVLLVEDIIDTGLSLAFLKEHLAGRGARSLAVCVAVDKPERRVTAVDVDYRCFLIKEGFLVGYGLDCAERYRSLPAIYEIKP